MLGHENVMSCEKFQENQGNRQKACATDNCVIDFNVDTNYTNSVI